MRILLKAFGKLTVIQSISRDNWVGKRRIYLMMHIKPPFKTLLLHEATNPQGPTYKKAVFEWFGERTANGMPIYEFVDLV